MKHSAMYILGACFECEGCVVHDLTRVVGKPLLQGFTAGGFFAEYALVDWRNAIKLPTNLDIE